MINKFPKTPRPGVKTFALIALSFLTAFAPKNTPGNLLEKTSSKSIIGTDTNQPLAIVGSAGASAYFDNVTVYTYTFSSTRTPISWQITGGTILSGAGTTSITVKWNTPNGSLSATSAYVKNGCRTVDPPPRRCCWTPPSGQNCNSPSNPCNNTAARVATTTTSQKVATPSVATPPGPCCKTVDDPPYQDCDYIRHVGSLTITPLTCVVSTPVLSNNQYNIVYGQSVTLQASLGAGTTSIRWYDQLTGGNFLQEGPTYTIPAVNVSTVKYYAESYTTNVPSPICSNYSARVEVTVNASCPTMGTPIVQNKEVLYGKPITIQAQPGTNGAGVRWYTQTTGGSHFYEGNYYDVSSNVVNATYYLESYGTFGTVQCTSTRVPVSITRPPKPTVQTEHIRIPNITTGSQVNALTQNQKHETVSYFDGLGRVIQQIQIKMTPAGNDIIAPVEFDASGRVSKQYLPYTITSSDGLFQNNYKAQQANFYVTAGNKVADDTHPFSQAVYEASPRGLILEQGSLGVDRQPGSGHSTRFGYTFNDANEVRTFNADGTSTAFYAANVLSKNISTSPDGKITITFTDGRGRTILKKQQLDETIGGVMVNYLETYYIYNNLNQLVFIISPKGVAGLKSNGWVFTTIKDDLSYQFIYDEKGRMIEKKTPGQGWTYFVYDDLDRLVLMQDPYVARDKKWIYVKYDMKGRTVSTGLYKNTTQLTRALVQGIVNSLYKPGNVQYPESAWYESKGAASHGYTNNTFPKTNADNTAPEVLNVNYYDNYDFDNNGTADYAYTPQGLTGEGTPTAFTQNLPTGSKRLIIGTATWLTAYVFYDSYHRPIQVRKNNHLNNDLTATANITTSVYDFEGKTTRTKNYHNAGSGKVTTVINRMEYDVKGRLIKVFQNNDAASSDQLVALYEYNELGQVIDKKLHNTSGNNFLQSVDYRYTILGQLSSINNSQLATDHKNDDSDDLFGIEYLYNQVDAVLGNTALYDGNISALTYKGVGAAPGIADQQSYKFQYDKAGQLKKATSQKYGAVAWDKEVNALDENLTYDYNGNIITLARSGRKHQETTTYINETIDNLTYTYNAGDQLTKVEDASGNITGFSNGSTAATEYTYDTHGSLTADLNKGISSITYNFLGKPSVITFTDGRRVEYVYDAAGSKLTTKTYQGATLQSTQDYVDNFVYENGILSFFSSPEGRVVKKGSILEYQYAIADHQGNTRVLFTSAPPVAQVKTASMEAASNTDFRNYTNLSDFDLMDHTDAGTVNIHSQKLTGGNNSQIGLTKSYAVVPGDKVKIEAYAKYFNPQNTSSNVTGFAAAITSAFGLSAASTGEALKAFNSLSNYGGLIAAGGEHSSNGFPRLYVNILLFDKNYKLVGGSYQQIDGGEQPLGNATKLPHDYMSAEVTVKEPGFAYVYISHENATIIEGYFDDVVMTHTPSNIVVQYNDYYPLGLQTGNSWTRENSTNNFLYNEGSELNKNTNWYEMFYRGYDPALGRMLQVDPYAAMYSSYSTYSYAMNNPVGFNDPSGGLALAKNDNLEPDQMARQGGGGTPYYTVDSRGMFTGGGAEFGGGGSGGGFGPGWINAWAESQPTEVKHQSSGPEPEDGHTTKDPAEIAKIIEAGRNGNLDLIKFGYYSLYVGPDPDEPNAVFTEEKFVPFGQQQPPQQDPFQQSAGERIWTIQEFYDSNKGLTRDQIINQRRSQGPMQPGGPTMRYVRNPLDKRVIDMRHMLIVGPQGPLVGGAVEIAQWADGQPSGMNPQDFYSNDLGFTFNGYRRLYGLGDKSMYATYLYNFFTTEHYYNKKKP